MLEIIGLSVEDAITIESLGGERIELIQAFSEGGLTPSYGTVKEVAQKVKIPVNVMVRPHSRSFNYSKYDLDVMREDARIIKDLGANNLVIGILDQDGLPDIKAMEYVLSSTDAKITFHRAFDECSDLLKALEILKSYDRVDTILTSGGPGKAQDNIEILKAVIENRGHINILVGSGVSNSNLEGLFSQLKNPNFHVGTAVRNGNYDDEINRDELSNTVSKYRSLNMHKLL